MFPVLSGPEAKRYIEPETETYLLFPYSRGVLYARETMEERFPNAWTYLQRWRPELIRRDGGALDDEEWYRFSRSQSLERAGVAKLFAAGTVPSLRFSFDSTGDFFLTGGRVDGVVPAEPDLSWYLLGVLNGPIADFVFRRIGRQKQGDYFEANKQFIAPLPIPDVVPSDRADIAALARSLQQRWTHRRDLMRAVEERLSVLARSRHAARWLWPELPTLEDTIEQAPASLRGRADRRDWATKQLEEREAQACERLQAALDRGGGLEARYEHGELKLFAGGAPVLSRIYLDEPAGRVTEAYWRWLILSQQNGGAARFAAELRKPPSDAMSPAATQFVQRVGELAAEVAAIDAEERAMNERLYELYALTTQERVLVERDMAARR